MGNGLDAWRPGAEATLQAYQKRFSLPAPCNDPENDRNRSRLKEECMSLSPATLLQVRRRLGIDPSLVQPRCSPARQIGDSSSISYY